MHANDIPNRRRCINVCRFLREAGMFAARSGAAVPLREAVGAKPAEEHPRAHLQSTVLDCEARLVPGRLRAAVGRGSQKGDPGIPILLLNSFESVFLKSII